MDDFIIPKELSDQLKTAMVSFEQLETDHEAVFDMLDRMEQEGVSRGMMLALESIDPDFIHENYPVATYTEEPSDVNLEIAMEGILEGVMKAFSNKSSLLMGAIIAILGWVIKKILEFMNEGKESGGSSSSTPNTSTVGEVVDEVRREPTVAEVIEEQKTLDAVRRAFPQLFAELNPDELLNMVMQMCGAGMSLCSSSKNFIGDIDDLLIKKSAPLDDFKAVNKRMSSTIENLKLDMRDGRVIALLIDAFKRSPNFKQFKKGKDEYVTFMRNLSKLITKYIDDGLEKKLDKDEFEREIIVSKHVPDLSNDSWTNDIDSMLENFSKVADGTKSEADGFKRDLEKLDKVDIDRGATSSVAMVASMNVRASTLKAYRKYLSASFAIVNVNVSLASKLSGRAMKIATAYRRFNEEGEKVIKELKEIRDVQIQHAEAELVRSGIRQIPAVEAHYDSDHPLGQYFN